MTIIIDYLLLVTFGFSIAAGLYLGLTAIKLI